MSHKKEKDNFEVLEVVSSRGNGWLQDVVRDVSSRSTAQQVAIGGASGWAAGYLCVKVGKLAAITLGTSILVLQIAQHQGYIKIDWRLLEKDVDKAKKAIERQTRHQYQGVFENLKTFFKNNVYLAGSFAGGFLIGVTF
ncbi:FUN14 domain-containing protein 1B-like [Saccostrea echinata]|uniref:FUN14 domain-containing protein 1B-like n=1 Tax=Saccostrea echinata TaxID=191078 RepID=UPI002A823883|nr:FUN14 domain-containing protein 1B-like [Saccostrea echinata]